MYIFKESVFKHPLAPIAALSLFPTHSVHFIAAPQFLVEVQVRRFSTTLAVLTIQDKSVSHAHIKQISWICSVPVEKLQQTEVAIRAASNITSGSHG